MLSLRHDKDLPKPCLMQIVCPPDSGDLDVFTPGVNLNTFGTKIKYFGPPEASFTDPDGLLVDSFTIECQWDGTWKVTYGEAESVTLSDMSGLTDMTEDLQGS